MRAVLRRRPWTKWERLNNLYYSYCTAVKYESYVLHLSAEHYIICRSHGSIDCLHHCGSHIRQVLIGGVLFDMQALIIRGPKRTSVETLYIPVRMLWCSLNRLVFIHLIVTTESADSAHTSWLVDALFVRTMWYLTVNLHTFHSFQTFLWAITVHGRITFWLITCHQQCDN